MSRAALIRVSVIVTFCAFAVAAAGLWDGH
jgi:hypothetical protein